MRFANKVTKALRVNSKGASLIEVLIGLALLGLVAGAFIGGLSTAFKSNIIADERSTAQSLAQSQMEYVKSQDYSSAPAGGDATYLKIDLSENPYYFVKSINHAGDTVNDIKGVPWDTENGQLSTNNDEGIQKVTIIVQHSDKGVFTLEDYKVDR